MWRRCFFVRSLPTVWLSQAMEGRETQGNSPCTGCHVTVMWLPCDESRSPNKVSGTFTSCYRSNWQLYLIVSLILSHHPRYPVNTMSWPNVGLMVVQRQRRWASFKPALESISSLLSKQFQPFLQRWPSICNIGVTLSRSNILQKNYVSSSVMRQERVYQ